MIKGVLGIIDKMRIEVYDSKKYLLPVKTIYVQLNPEKYTLKNKVDFCEGQAMGTTGSDLKFNKIETEEVTFDFLFDSSGVIPPGKIVDGKGVDTLMSTLSDVGESIKPAFVNPFANVKTVEKEVEEFKKLLMGYNGDKHQTAYLRLIWGGYQLDCRLKNMDIEYYLFRRDGRPIRAKVKCTFKGTIDYKLMVAKENKRSPDLTHERSFEMNDRLTVMSEDIYESNIYYIDVAKYNKLLSFRNIPEGNKIYFPPVK